MGAIHNSGSAKLPKASTFAGSGKFNGEMIYHFSDKIFINFLSRNYQEKIIPPICVIWQDCPSLAGADTLARWRGDIIAAKNTSSRIQKTSGRIRFESV